MVLSRIEAVPASSIPESNQGESSMRARDRLISVAILSLAATGGAAASDVEHYSGKPAKTLDQAVENLGRYNERLETILAKDELTAGDMERIHELSYTLENALRRIHSEVGRIAGDLETVHLASERREADTVSDYGRRYLRKSSLLVP